MDQAAARSAIDAVAAGAPAASFSGRLIGSRCWLHVKLARLDDGDRPAVSLAIARDISNAAVDVVDARVWNCSTSAVKEAPQRGALSL